MEKGINKVVEIVKETGEHVVFLSSDGESALVVMSLEEFQFLRKGLGLAKNRLTDLTEEQFLNKINREIADWKNAQSSGLDDVLSVDTSIPGTQDSVKISTDVANSSQSATGSDKEERFYFEPVDDSRNL